MVFECLGGLRPYSGLEISTGILWCTCMGENVSFTKASTDKIEMYINFMSYVCQAASNTG